MTTDDELLRRIAAGDRAAYAALYDRYAPRVYGLVFKFLRNRNDSDDVFQDVFWQLWRQAGHYDPSRSRADSWLLLLTRSRALDFLRRNGRALPTAELVDGACESDPGLSLTRHEDSARLSAAMGELMPDQRTVVWLSFFGGLSHEEIARHEHVPLGTVKSRIRRGIEKLRAILRKGPE